MYNQTRASSMLTALEDSLRHEARMITILDQQPLFFKLLCKPRLRLEDEQGRLFDIDEDEVTQHFAHVDLDSFRWIKVKDFNFESKFDFSEGRYRCVQLSLYSINFKLLGEKGKLKFKMPLLRVSVLPETVGFEDLTESIRGYLNRIGKRKFVSQVEQPVEKIRILKDEVPKAQTTLQLLSQKPKKKVEIDTKRSTWSQQ